MAGTRCRIRLLRSRRFAAQARSSLRLLNLGCKRKALQPERLFCARYAEIPMPSYFFFFAAAFLGFVLAVFFVEAFALAGFVAFTGCGFGECFAEAK